MILSVQGAPAAFLYCCISFVCTLITFLAFRISAGISRYFSVHDTVNIVSAVIAAGLTTTAILFTFTRLDGIPRSIPILQGLVLATGLLVTRGLMLLWDKDEQPVEPADHSAAEHIIMIGSSHLTSLYIKLLQAHAPAQRHVVAVLDDNHKLFGRTMCGVPVVGSANQLDSVVEEFAVHGVLTDRVIIGGDETLLSAAALDAVRETCAQRDIAVDFVPNLIGLAPLPRARRAPALRLAEAPPRAQYEPPAYFWYKRVIDFVVALVAIVIFSPLFLVVSVLVLFDFGAPVVFWQKRIGRNGKSFLLYKFRTLHARFDRDGNLNGNCNDDSWISKFLRRLRLDELPQLFHVLVGEMSLIGPRPLLPQDQPANSTLRLMVRPGITGWAQINGGNLITNEEKGALDDWYVRNASLWLDLRIALYTLVFLFTGERRVEHAVQEATLLQQTHGSKRVEVRDIVVARRASSPMLAISARAGASQPRRANLD